MNPSKLVLMIGLAAAFLAGPTFVPPATAAQVIDAEGAVIELETGKGRLVRLDRAAATVFVAEPEIADIQVKSPTLVYVFAKKPGETSLYAVDSRERILLNARLRVSHNLSRLRDAVDRLLPDSDIRLVSIDGAVVLSGIVGSAEDSEDVRRLATRFAPEEGAVINQLRVDAPNQVSLRVRIAEVSREVVKQLGFNWESVYSPGDFAFGIATGRDALIEGVFNRSTMDTFSGSLVRGSLNLNALIDALETEGLISVLAEPNLTAVSGETASFLAGGEFPIPVSQEDGKITIEFKKFGVSLSFTPTILGRNSRISMRVRPEVSQLTTTGSVQANNFTIPALTTRRAETTVELASGQSLAIAGLLQDSINHDLRRFPGLGSLPILGALFRSNDFKRNETELVVIVTPYIVRPVSQARMAAPTDGLVMPSDTERLFAGLGYRPQLMTTRPVPTGRKGRRLFGPVGFELE